MLSIDIPVPAMLAGRGFRADCVARRQSTPDTDVEVDKALPGREAPGVTSPDLDPTWRNFGNFSLIGMDSKIVL